MCNVLDADFCASVMRWLAPKKKARNGVAVPGKVLLRCDITRRLAENISPLMCASEQSPPGTGLIIESDGHSSSSPRMNIRSIRPGNGDGDLLPGLFFGFRLAPENRINAPVKVRTLPAANEKGPNRGLFFAQSPGPGLAPSESVATYRIIAVDDLAAQVFIQRPERLAFRLA
jgi:hypothetical protein